MSVVGSVTNQTLSVFSTEAGRRISLVVTHKQTKRYSRRGTYLPSRDRLLPAVPFDKLLPLLRSTTKRSLGRLVGRRRHNVQECRISKRMMFARILFSGPLLLPEAGMKNLKPSLVATTTTLNGHTVKTTWPQQQQQPSMLLMLPLLLLLLLLATIPF